MSVEPIAAVTSTAASAAALLTSTVTLPTNIAAAAAVDNPAQVQGLIGQLELDQTTATSSSTRSQILHDIQLLQEARSLHPPAQGAQVSAPVQTPTPGAELPGSLPDLSGTLFNAKG